MKHSEAQGGASNSQDIRALGASVATLGSAGERDSDPSSSGLRQGRTCWAFRLEKARVKPNSCHADEPM